MSEEGEPLGPAGPGQGGRLPVRVFLSYRRDDTKKFVGGLYNLLAQRFGDENVFMDIDSLGPGEKFAEKIREKVGACDLFLAVIGPDWLTVREAGGRRRIDAPRDWVRAEIRTALGRDVEVIPVLVNDAEMPPREQLPSGITGLAELQAFRIGPRWRADVTRLADAIEAAAAERRARAGTRSPEPEQAAPEPEQTVPGPDPHPDGAGGTDFQLPGPRVLVGIGAAVVVTLAMGAFFLLRDGGGMPGPVERSVDVSARAVWTDTGVDVAEGATFTVASGGVVSTDAKFADQAAKETGPDGVPGTVGDRSYKSVTFEANHGALIWRIRADGPTFPLGIGGTLTARTAGRLFLGINDLDPCNNKGSYTATIRADGNGVTMRPLPPANLVPEC